MTPLLSEEDALTASAAYQVTTIEEHDDPIIINAHNAEVLILVLTITLRFMGACAGCRLQQHVDVHLYDMMSGLKCAPASM